MNLARHSPALTPSLLVHCHINHLSRFCVHPKMACQSSVTLKAGLMLSRSGMRQLISWMFLWSSLAYHSWATSTTPSSCSRCVQGAKPHAQQTDVGCNICIPIHPLNYVYRHNQASIGFARAFLTSHIANMSQAVPGKKQGASHASQILA